MISGGNATVYVADMDKAVQFYSETLGLTLTNRFGNHWATLESAPGYWCSDHSGAGLTIGLHPSSASRPAPGTAGGVGFGLETYEPAEQVLARLQGKGVRITSEIIRYEGGNCFMILDLDGLPTYVNEFPPDMIPESDLAKESGADEATSADTRLGGHAIVYVSNMDAAVRFYSEKLGLPLIYRFEDKFATVEAGNLSLAIHPKTPNTPDPGKKGSVALGLQVDEPIEGVVSRLSERGVRISSESAVPDAGKRVEFEDEDGNSIYLWEVKAISARAAAASR
jgi:catechol 2,3-dioxygenase-like lactoylglutathione lyase family enzyme